MISIRNILLSLIPTVILITLCYLWIDPVFAFWIDDKNIKQFVIFRYCTHLVDAIMIWSFLYYCYFAWAYAKNTKTKQQSFHAQKTVSLEYPGLNIANSVAVSIFIKDALKAPFGRYWPSTWINNNPSLIHDHAYGFHCFHQGAIYQSFPSGHTTVVVAFMTALWFSYPRALWRWGGVAVASAVVIGLLANNYHFISDCLAGGWIGAVVALYVRAIDLSSRTRL